MLDALLQLGRQTHTPLSIEYINPTDLKPDVTVHLTNAPVGDIVRAILGTRTTYTWDLEDGVIHVARRASASPEPNLLDHTMREFTIAVSTTLVAAATLALPAQLTQEMAAPKPARGVTGVGGDIMGERREDRAGPLTMRQVTVRRVLNRLVSEGNMAAWVVVVPPARLRRLPLPEKGAWYVIAYDDPRRDWGPFVAKLLRQNWEPESGPGSK